MSRKNKNVTNTVFISILVGIIAISTCAIVGYIGVAYNNKNNNNNNNNSSIDNSFNDTLSVDSNDNSSVSSSVSSENTVSETQSSVTQNTSSNTSSDTNTITNKNPNKNPNTNTNSDEMVCYLTFDDGPSKTVTYSILDTLDRYNVKATFFVTGTGYTDGYVDIVKRGHTIGLHTNTHEWSIYKSTEAYFNDLQKVSDKVYEKTLIRSKIIRFPGGSSNTVSRKQCKGIMTTLTKMVEEKGYNYIDWNVDSTDALNNNRTKEDILNSVLKYCLDKNGKPQKEICVLMHDTGAKKATAEALPEIIEGLSKLGYTFKALDINSNGFHHDVNN